MSPSNIAQKTQEGRRRNAYVIAAMGAGIVSPEEAASLSAVLAQHRQVVELADIAVRLERLEHQMEDE